MYLIGVIDFSVYFFSAIMQSIKIELRLFYQMVKNLARPRPFNFVIVLSLFQYYLPSGKMCGSLVQQTLFPFIQECFLSCLIVNDSVRLEKKIFVKLFSSLCFHLLEKAGALHLKKKEKTMIPFTKECFVPCFVEIDTVVQDVQGDKEHM